MPTASENIASFRLRPSLIHRLTHCTALITLPRHSYHKKGKAELTSGKNAAEEGVVLHKQFELGKLKDQEKVIGPYVAEDHEVNVRMDIATRRPLPPVSDNDGYRAKPESALEMVGAADYLKYDPDTGTVRVLDLKTGKKVEEYVFQQLDAYAMSVDPEAKPELTVWHYRARTSRVYVPADFGVSTESVRALNEKALRATYDVLAFGESMATMSPGQHCSRCPARFSCEGYADFVQGQPVFLRNFLEEELEEFHNKEEV